MMESSNLLFKKPSLMVSIVAKWFECVISLVFKFAWYQISEFEPTESTTGHNERVFLKTHWDGEGQFFRVIKKVDNRATVDT